MVSSILQWSSWQTAHAAEEQASFSSRHSAVDEMPFFRHHIPYLRLSPRPHSCSQGNGS